MPRHGKDILIVSKVRANRFSSGFPYDVTLRAPDKAARIGLKWRRNEYEV